MHFHRSPDCAWFNQVLSGFMHGAPVSARIRLPIIPSILLKVYQHCLPKSMEPDTIMLWAASVLCFFGFFRAGEITVPTLTSFDPSQHLGWGDVAIDSTQSPQTLRVRLKQSKTDQLGKGVDVFVGKTGDSLCPVAGVLAYMGTFLSISR